MKLLYLTKQALLLVNKDKRSECIERYNLQNKNKKEQLNSVVNLVNFLIENNNAEFIEEVSEYEQYEEYNKQCMFILQLVYKTLSIM